MRTWFTLLALACFSAILVMVRTRQESIAKRGPHEIDLELGADDVAFVRRLSERRVAAGRVDDARDGARVDIPMLLRKLRRERQSDVHLAIRDQSELRPKRRHQPLRVEARCNSII